MRIVPLRVLALAFALLMTPASQSGELEPPDWAFNKFGKPTATPMQPPSWQDFRDDGRFKLVLAGRGVLDRETGLVWEQRPGSDVTTNLLYRGQADNFCWNKSVDGKSGWRLPTAYEFASLMEPGPSYGFDGQSYRLFRLPANHPFEESELMTNFWTDSVGGGRDWHETHSTEGYTYSPTRHWVLWYVTDGWVLRELSIFDGSALSQRRVWCVRAAGDPGHDVLF